MKTTFECTCGERYTTLVAAWACKKCRQYLTEADYLDRKVWEINATDEVVNRYQRQ